MKILRKKFGKGLAFFLLLNMFNMIFSPGIMALTGGPNAPEATGFTPSGTSDMVNPFTGDFSYNIPLMDVGGYPLTMSYNAGITPDQEASWVGLGWNFNVGSVNRNVRGIPDDYAGEEIITEHTMKPNETFGVTLTASSPADAATDAAADALGVKKPDELLTFETDISTNYNISYNTYNGFGFSWGISPSLDIGIRSRKENSKFDVGAGLVPGLDLTVGSEDGVGITPKLGLKIFAEGEKRKSTLNTTIGFPFSSREGAKGMSMSASLRYSSTPGNIAKHTPEFKDEKKEYGIGASAFKGFAAPTYPTTIKFDRESAAVTFTISPEKLASILGDNERRFTGGGYYTGQYESNDTERNPAYGFMYEGLTNDENSVLDFNREKDAGYNSKTTNMPVTVHTHDTYSVTGEGVGGTFRLFRGDVAHVGDNVSKEKGTNVDVSLSGGFNLSDKAAFKHIKIGVDFKNINVDNESGRWTDLSRVQSFNSPRNRQNSTEQNVYFAQIGEMTPETDLNYTNNALLNDKIYAYHQDNGVVDGRYTDEDGNKKNKLFLSEDAIKRTKRKSRISSFKYLTAKEAEYQALEDIYSYSTVSEQKNNGSGQNLVSDVQVVKTPLARIDGDKKENHISEIRVTNSSGQRYVYGIPVYNKTQRDVVFSVDTKVDRLINIGGNNVDQVKNAKKTGLVSYEPEDASLSNKRGLDHYFERTTQPAYAASYLMNYLLSSDYVDSDEEKGPSDGDLGSYVKFNHQRTSTSYKWRTPFEKGQANFMDGLEGKTNDDKGSYSYGEKELWYTHSIETRTHVAEFILEDRKDGIGVKDEYGGLSSRDFERVADSDKQKKLTKIILYSKRDYLNGKREPLKTVHFEYDYSLCPDTPNSVADENDPKDNGNGKLTLRKVWFTYGNSEKGEENPYIFNYADADFDGVADANLNPGYSKKNYDRWGFFQMEKPNVRNDEVPYTDQDKSVADVNAATYSLNTIKTPNGGEIRVHYEADDYAYVQNRAAMRMFKVLGVSGTDGDEDEDHDPSNDTPVKELYNKTGSKLNGRLFLHIDLGEGFQVPQGETPKSYFKDHYLQNMEQLSYRIKAKILGFGENNEASFENIKSYCLFEKDNIHFAAPETDSEGNTVYTTAILKLQGEALNQKEGASKNVHPFIKAAWLFARLQYSRELSGSTDASGGSVEQVLRSIGSAVEGMLELIFSFRGFMKVKNHGREIDCDFSFVRLHEPDAFKIGGGCRVKAIVMLDRWDEMISKKEGTATKEVAGYGQVYDYTTTEGANENARVISSGVAAYEPIIGGEENPWKNIRISGEKVPLAPDKEYYSEVPYGESYFPAPVVGYSKVTTTPVKVLDRNYVVEDLKSNGTGYVEEEFYTAFDFPTVVSETKLLKHEDREEPVKDALRFKSSHGVYCSQGYKIELNDMHGKPKAKRVMPDKATGDNFPVSEVFYNYRTKQNQPDRLNSLVPLVDAELNISQQEGREIGTTIEVTNDTRYYTGRTKGGGANVNVKLSWPPPPVPFPFPIISAFPSVDNELATFSSITTTKVVNRYGVLEETVAYENGQSISTKNLAWDALTGEVLLTSVDNEFNNTIYNFTYPAHWSYDEMGLAYQNDGARFTSISGNENFLINGDEFLVEIANGDANDASNNTFKKAYFLKEGNAGTLRDENNEVISTFKSAILIRSGARNVASVPVASVSSLKNPISGNKVDFTNKEVLNTGATEFKNLWKPFCNCGELSNPETANPFLIGQQGQLRAWRSWTYLTGRTQDISNGDLNIVKDGTFNDFLPFWKLDGSTDVKNEPFYRGTSTNEEARLVEEQNNIDASKWQFVTEVENFNPIGQEIENKDALKRFSMAQYGYARNLPIGVSNNSRYGETGYDGFEDYEYDDCNDDHFSWRAVLRLNPVEVQVVDNEAHTGRKSILVMPTKSTRITKKIDCGN